jgi:hypothetical protein
MHDFELINWLLCISLCSRICPSDVRYQLWCSRNPCLQGMLAWQIWSVGCIFLFRLWTWYVTCPMETILTSLHYFTGEYTNVSGSSSCMKCAAGTFAIEKASQKCTNCTPGFVSPQPSASYCDPCPPGQYQPQFGGSTCRTCDPGSFAPFQNSTVCAECPPGTSQSRPGT